MANTSRFEKILIPVLVGAAAIGIANRIPYVRENVYEPVKQAILERVEDIGQYLSLSNYLPKEFER